MFERSPRTNPGKPNTTYVELIKRAIQKSPTQALSVSEIYASIESSHPFFRTSTKGWKNTVRHLLSLTPCFVNTARLAPLSGKGGLWTIDPDASDTACRKRQRFTPADRPLTTVALAERSSTNVRVDHSSSSSGYESHHVRTGSGYSDNSLSSSSATSSTHPQQTELESGTVSSVLRVSPSSTSSVDELSSPKAAITSDKVPSSFTFDFPNPFGSHQKIGRLTTGEHTPRLLNPNQMYGSSDGYPIPSVNPDQSRSASTYLGNQYSRPQPAPPLPPPHQISATSYSSNTMYLNPRDWPSSDQTATSLDQAYPIYHSISASGSGQIAPPTVSSSIAAGHLSGPSPVWRTNYSSDKHATSTEHYSVRLGYSSSSNSSSDPPPLPSPSYARDSHDIRREGHSSSFPGYSDNNTDDYNRSHDYEIQGRRSLNEQNEERKLHSLSFRSTPIPDPNQHSFHLPSPSPSASSSLMSASQRSPYTTSHAFETPSTAFPHPPYHLQQNYSGPQAYGSSYGGSTNHYVKQEGSDWW